MWGGGPLCYIEEEKTEMVWACGKGEGGFPEWGGGVWGGGPLCYVEEEKTEMVGHVERAREDALSEVRVGG